MRRAWIVWAAIVIPTWLVLVACTHWEPILRDGWGHFNLHRATPMTAANIWEFAKGTYLHNNPRLGQVLTMLLYTPGPWHPIVTPIVELSFVWLLAILALGRRPSLASVDDALMFATILALMTAAVPQLGPMLFYRPFTGNYLCGWAITLGLLVPYRLHAESPRAWGWWWIPIQLALGMAAGLSNEHTVPAITLLAMTAVIAFVRRGERIRPWMIAGIVGLVAGGLALYFAPGQDVRYNGLAKQHPVFERIVTRTLRENVVIVAAGYWYAWRALAWVVLAAVVRWRGPTPAMTRARKASIIIGIAASLAIACTLLASPKQGTRLDFAPVTLACAALASWLVPMLVARWTRVIAWTFATIALVYAGWRCLSIYHELAPEFASRLAILEAAAPGTTVTLPAYTCQRSHWFLGDDIANASERANVAAHFGLTAIVLETAQPPATIAPEDP